MPTDGRPKRPGPDTRDAMASARTVPSDPGPHGTSSLVTGDTQVAPGVPSISAPRLPREGGEVLGNRYEILGELGRGGEGVVYRARDLKADAIVALKMLQQDEGSEHRLRRFRRELAMARKVTHPNVVRIHDLVELPGRFGLSMELVEGEPLDERIAHGTLSKDALVRLALDLARALAAAHEAGVTHRDLKPGNVLLRAEDGRAMVTDFGVSRAHGRVEEVKLSMARDATPLQLTREGAIIGTPQYMAPEQLEGQLDVGPAADVYAYGMLLREAATGHRLHEAETLGDLKRLRSEAPAPPLREDRPDLPRALCDVVDRCLQRQVRDRYASGKELLAAVEPIGQPPKTRAGVAWVIGAAVLLLGGGVVLARQTGRKLPPPVVVPAASGSAATTPPLVLHVANVSRVTFGDGCEEFPSFTPDGKTVLYDGTVGRDAFVYALDVQSGEKRQLTQVRGWDIAAAASPDGKQMAFVRFEGEHVGTYVAPLDGSAPPRFLAQGGVRPSWSRDGRAVWAGDGSPLTAYDVTSGKALRTAGESLAVRTAQTLELSDGALVANLPIFEATDSNHSSVRLFGADGRTRPLLEGNLDEVIALSPDQRHILTTRTLAASSAELVDVPLDGSPVTSLASTGVSARKGLSFSRDGKHLAWSTCAEQPQVVRFDAHGKISGSLEGDLVAPSSLAALPGGALVGVVCARAGKPAPWITSLNNDVPPRPIPVGALSVREMAVSADGARFAIVASGSGIYVGSLTGDPALHQVTSDKLDSDPEFYAGGAALAFTRRSADASSRVMTVPAAGGDVRPLLDVASQYPTACGPGDRFVYLAGATSSRVLPMLWDGKSAARPLSSALVEGRYADPRCAADGRHVLLVRGDTEILEVDVASGAITRTITTPTGDQLAEPTYTPLGVAAIRVHFQGNVWLADASF